jgi:Ca-activated chloride channel family protein
LLDEFAVPLSEEAATPSTDWRWAVAVAEFGMILRQSEHQGNASLEQVRSLAEGAKEGDPLREEFIELVGLYESLNGPAPAP